MKKNYLRRSVSGFLLFLFMIDILSRVFFPAADAAVPSADTIRAYAQDIITFEVKKSGATDAQTFVNDIAAPNAAGMYDWFVFALMQHKTNVDFSVYETLLKKNAAEKSGNAVEKERVALILSAFDGNEDFIRETLDASANGLGIMSKIFALHIINNGFSTDTVHSEDVISDIITMQTSDGGWSLNGDKALPDETAMAIQTLAPYYGKMPIVTESIDKALSALSGMQNENGGFFSFGNENAESCAQVIIALCSLDISPFDDERFIKNGVSVYDRLLQFRLADGSFEHIRGKGYNFKATEQALSAFVAADRYISGSEAFFCADKHEPCKTDTVQRTTKLPLMISFIAVGMIFLILTICLAKKKKKKLADLFLILSVITAVVGFFICSDIQKPEDYYTVTTLQDTANTVTAHISVTCDTIKSHASEKDNIPRDGIVLQDTEITLAEGSTVYDFLIYASKKYGLQTENDSVSAATAYITGINYIYQFDYGPLSGWMFTVNGKNADLGCGEYAVNNGDKIQWIYTCSLGEDISLPLDQ